MTFACLFPVSTVFYLIFKVLVNSRKIADSKHNNEFAVIYFLKFHFEFSILQNKNGHS